MSYLIKIYAVCKYCYLRLRLVVKESYSSHKILCGNMFLENFTKIGKFLQILQFENLTVN